MKRLWCKLTHRQASWPIRGKYHCPKCLTEFRCPWEIQKHIDEPGESVQDFTERKVNS